VDPFSCKPSQVIRLVILTLRRSRAPGRLIHRCAQMEVNIFTVLIVDKDDSFRPVLRELLERSGCFDFCIEASSALEAIKRAKHFLPNLAVVDFSLPEMSGLQLAQELRGIMPRLPIFMLTADRNVHVENEALSCGIDAVFSKDDDIETLPANALAVCGMNRDGHS